MSQLLSFFIIHTNYLYNHTTISLNSKSYIISHV